MAMVGIQGSPGVRKARAYRLEGCLEMTSRMKMMERIRKMKIRLKKDPLKPMASMTSITKMHRNINPTSFVTNIPKREGTRKSH